MKANKVCSSNALKLSGEVLGDLGVTQPHNSFLQQINFQLLFLIAVQSKIKEDFVIYWEVNAGMVSQMSGFPSCSL